MSTAVVVTPAADAIAGIQPPSLRLLQTAACSVKELLRPGGMVSSNLRSNFAHLMAGSPPALPPIETFVCTVARTLGVSALVVATSLVYVERLSGRLPRSASGRADTPYRIFLAALLLADKYWSDRAVTIKSLVVAAGGLFRHREILAMERALLRVLRFDLSVSPEHIRRFADDLGLDIGAA
ncbi:hypothetical protein H4R18_003603 [Coemansia javaensis]|uniref:Cyclin-like domain-containing protein n=1 Tax=Coemansia javaensis TaxID=2761396 RepID=A0A9W8LH09_9FUNG|nr:hypothetical protein H4R18_003603 [Coemansia javaensis]